jgi:hypothetical protein
MRGRQKATPSGWRIVCACLCAAAVALQTLVAFLPLIAPPAIANELGDVVICSHDGALLKADEDSSGKQTPSDTQTHCFVCVCSQMTKALAAPAVSIIAPLFVTSWRLRLAQQQRAPHFDPQSPYASRAPPPHV